MPPAVELPIAHFGHWYVSFPVYFGPVVLIAAYVKWSGWREGRRRRPGAGDRRGRGATDARERARR